MLCQVPGTRLQCCEAVLGGLDRHLTNNAPILLDPCVRGISIAASRADRAFGFVGNTDLHIDSRCGRMEHGPAGIHEQRILITSALGQDVA
jgi:hypothetical protein